MAPGVWGEKVTITSVVSLGCRTNPAAGAVKEAGVTETPDRFNGWTPWLLTTRVSGREAPMNSGPNSRWVGATAMSGADVTTRCAGTSHGDSSGSLLVRRTSAS